jgi:hypothetical protein
LSKNAPWLWQRGALKTAIRFDACDTFGTGRRPNGVPVAGQTDEGRIAAVAFRAYVKNGATRGWILRDRFKAEVKGYIKAWLME